MRVWPIRLQDLRCGFRTRRKRSQYGFKSIYGVHLTQIVRRYGKTSFMNAFYVRKVPIANE